MKKTVLVVLLLLTGIVPWSVIAVPIRRSGVAVGRSGVTIRRRWIAIGSRRRIPVVWAASIPIPWAADDSTNNRCTRAYNSCRCPYTCPYNRPRTVPPTTVATPPAMTP